MSGEASTPAQDPSVETLDAAPAAAEPEVVSTDTPAEGSLTDPAERLQPLEQEFDSLKQEPDALQSQWVRLAAEYDNFR